MTKRKIIEDLIKHPAGVTKNYFVGRFDDVGCVCNGGAIYLDKEFPNEVEDQKTFDLVKKNYEYIFEESGLCSLSNAIEIDRDVLQQFIKTHKRNASVDEKGPFIIGLRQERNNFRYICINPWYLRDQLEYVKNNRIFIRPDMVRYHYDDAVYIGIVYSFSDDFITTMCATLPVNWNGNGRKIVPDYIIGLDGKPETKVEIKKQRCEDNKVLDFMLGCMNERRA